MKLRILTETDCRSVLDMRDAIDIQQEAFTLLASGRSVDGLRSFATSDEPPGVAIFNPCFLKNGAGYGIKVVSDFYGNADRGVPRMTALVALFDGTTGAPHTVMEAGYLTDLRTGAGTGLAARYLARSDSRVLTVIGAGRVASTRRKRCCWKPPSRWCRASPSAPPATATSASPTPSPTRSWPKACAGCALSSMSAPYE